MADLAIEEWLSQYASGHYPFALLSPGQMHLVESEPRVQPCTPINMINKHE